MKKVLAALLAAVMVLSLAACGGSAAPAATEAPAAAPATDAATAAPATEASGKVYTVGICQLVTHDALDAATQGFQDALVAKLGADNVKFDLQNAAGDSNTCATIANGFVAEGVDLIMANATPALQAAVAATADIPVLGTSVTEYGVALGIQDFNGTPAATSPAPPTWRLWRIRPRCSRPGSPMPRTLVCCTAPPSPTPSTRWTPWRSI